MKRQEHGGAIPKVSLPSLRRLLLALSASAVSICLPAAEPLPAPDKSRYHLFHPTPRPWMREMSTDRPDKTESPYTVDAGHFQIEMDLVSYAHDRDRSDGTDIRTDAWAVAPVNLKAGLLNNLDLQLILEPYNHVRAKDRTSGTTLRQSGFGDITLRLKHNLWGNDSGRTALGFMPFIKFPTNEDDLGNDSIEGGIIVPFAAELGAGWGMGLMTEVDFLREESGGGYHSVFVNTITFGCDLTEKLGGYIEFFSEVSTERDSEWVGTLDVGLTYGLTDDIQLDAGINIGVTDSAPDLNPFVGISWRF